MEQFFTNIELVSNMCEFLNYKEQFELSQVSSDLQYIIVNHVWKTKFHKLEIFTTQMSFLLSDILKAYDFNFVYFDSDVWQRNCFLLTWQNLVIFLNLNVKNIKKLQLVAYSRECNSNDSIKNALPFRQKFPNLTELSFQGIKLEKRDLQQVAENCAKLETLVLNNCRDLNGKSLKIDRGIDVQVLKVMQNLNNLSICGCNYTFSNIKDIFNQLKLQQLTLNGVVYNDSENENNDLNLRNLKYYKELEMPTFCDNSDFLYFQTNILPHMENLCKLSLNTEEYIFINMEFFNILLKSCRSLTHLELQGFTINDFIALPSLNELILYDCELTYSHLKIVLSVMNLKCFTSTSDYSEHFECFPISPSLQKIDIAFNDDNIIELFEFNGKKLMNLTEFRCYADEMLEFSNFPKNLKILNIEAVFSTDYCSKLKYLQEITLNDTIEISDFLELLKHQHLRKLSVKDIHYISKSSLDLNVLNMSPQKNLRYFQLSYYNASFISDILLDLLNLNTKLSFACGIYNAKPITELVCHGKFPKRFTNINVYGVSIDCNSIRNQCVDQMESFIESIKQAGLKLYFLLQ